MRWPLSLFSRSKARAPSRRTASIPSGYAGAAVTRLTASMATWAGSANSNLEASLGVLRARGRQISNDNPYGRRFLSLVATHVIGPDGPTLQVRAKNQAGSLDVSGNAAVEVAWYKWSRTCDIAGRLSFPRMMSIAVKAAARDGESIIRIIRDKKKLGGMSLQILDADRLDETFNTTASNGNLVRMGIELATTGAPVAYYLRKSHPGDTIAGGSPLLERVPADEIVHLFLPERAEQVRGASWFHAVILQMHKLGKYEESAVVAAAVGASKVGFFERAADDDSPGGAAAASMADGTSGGSLSMSAEAGEMYELPAGYTFSSFNPDYPHANFDAFVKTILRSISAGLDIDYATLASDLESVNYSSMRAGALETREAWKALQKWMIDQAVMRIYSDWLGLALLRGDVILAPQGVALKFDRFDKFFDASEFLGRRWGWVDPMKDAQASRELLNARLTTRTRIAAEQGIDFADLVVELAAEEKLLEEAGLSSILASSPPTQPTQPTQNEDGSNGNDEDQTN